MQLQLERLNQKLIVDPVYIALVTVNFLEEKQPHVHGSAVSGGGMTIGPTGGKKIRLVVIGQSLQYPYNIL